MNHSGEANQRSESEGTPSHELNGGLPSRHFDRLVILSEDLAIHVRIDVHAGLLPSSSREPAVPRA